MGRLNARILKLERWRRDPNAPCPACRLVWVQLGPDDPAPQAAPCQKPHGCPWDSPRLIVVRHPPPGAWPPSEDELLAARARWDGRDFLERF